MKKKVTKKKPSKAKRKHKADDVCHYCKVPNVWVYCVGVPVCHSCFVMLIGSRI